MPAKGSVVDGRTVAPGLSAESLAELARSTTEHVQSLTRLGLLEPIDGNYAPGDVHRIRAVDAFAAAGVPAEALARASAQGTITLAYYDQLHQDPGTPSDAAIDTWSVVETERQLAATGFVPERQIEPPAIAFIDLTDLTRLASESGDREAARVAMAFTSLAGQVPEGRGGRLVKPLGDGVLLRFASARDAAEATLDVLDRVEPAGMPRGHAGIASGPVVVREGDVFGRKVNLAARISDQAASGQALTTQALADVLSGEGFDYAPVGDVTLQGIPEPIELARIWRRSTPR